MAGTKIRQEYNGAVGWEAISKATGINAYTLQKRVNNQGMTIDEAVKAQVLAKKRHRYRGIKGLPAIATRYDISVCSLKSLVGKGLTIHKAIQHLTKGGQNEKADMVIIDSSSERHVPQPHYVPSFALALGLITRSQYDEITNS